MNKKKVIVVVVCVIVLWIVIGIVDYSRVNSSNKPLFCVGLELADDGGSGKYIGLGYSFDIDGHLTADSWFDVDSYTYKIFGITVKQGEANPQKG